MENGEGFFQQSSTTGFGLESVLRQNIVNSEYYRSSCMTLKTVSEVVDEIYNNVQHLEPWMSGNARGPSSAFCLMHRLFTMRVTEDELQAMIDHEDSPYIRAVALLYLRYVCEPKALWDWCGPYISDPEELSPSPDGKTITVGDFLRDILLEQYYFETIFPRIPKKVQDDIVEDLRRQGLPSSAKGNAGTGGADRRGADDGNRRPASVKASLSVAMGQRAPNRAGAREEGRGKDPSAGRTLAPGPRQDDRDKGSNGRDRERERAETSGRGGREAQPQRRGSPPPRGDERNGSSRQDRDRERGEDRERERGHTHGGGGGSRRGDEGGGREREREREEGQQRGGGRSSNHRSRSRSRSRERGAGSRFGGGGGGGGYGNGSGRGGSPDRRRRVESPARERQQGGRDARDVFRDAAGGGGGGGGGRDVRDVFKDAAGGGRDVRDVFKDAARR
ncbi:MAG: hypothetical protein WDW38_001597 [Sanguina aurantia]